MKKVLALLLVLGLASLASAADGWIPVGGMSLAYGTHPAPTPPGVYEWTWSGDNGDGTTTYGKYTFDKFGGPQYGSLSVSNSIDSTAAYITQTFTFDPCHPTPAYRNTGTGTVGQQFLYWGRAGDGTAGLWCELEYDSGQVDHYDQTAGQPWQTTYMWVAPTIASETVTVRFGINREAGVTTGTRSLLVEDALLWMWGAYVPEWENWKFDIPEPMTLSLLALGGLGLIRRRRT
jgi:hypothetical protein